MQADLTGGRWREWARNVLNDKGAGKLLHLSARRFLYDLKRKDLEFHPDKVENCLACLNVLRHYKGRSAGSNFKPEPWQEFIIANIIGFYKRDTGLRRFSRAYIEVSRKNGKSFLVNALAIYFLLFDGEVSPEVIVGANSREQAKMIDFEMCSMFARQLDPKGKDLLVYRDEIRVSKSAGRLKVISADTVANDGYNPSVGIIDEYHAAPTSALRDVITSGMASRSQPFLFVITTAGFNKSYPCYKMRQTCIEILHGIKDEDNTFVAIFSLDEGDDWSDPATWIKANPNLGITVREAYLLEQVMAAKNNPSEEVGVRTKNLNQWCDAASVWIPDQYLMSAMKQRAATELKGKICFVGVDLSSVSDITAVSYYFPHTAPGKSYFRTDYYLPESALQDRYNKALYTDWARRGVLTLTPGNVTDYDYIMNDIMKNSQELEIMAVAYDRWNATQWAIKMTEAGMPLVEFGQNLGRFNGPTKELERMILSNMVEIEPNEITLFCFRNVVIKEDWNENRKPVKSAAENKIDGVVAMLQAQGVSMEEYYAGITN